MPKPIPNSVIHRHKAAIRRGELSLAFKCLQRDRLLTPAGTMFDYGCGHGEDIGRLQKLGMVCDGWDPAWRPNGAKQSADVVNLGYVLNVIEDVDERAAALREAWNLCQKILVVAARIVVGGWGKAEVEYGDGILTQIGTFQKFYTQAELREYLETTLGADALPAAPGVFYVFRDETLRQQFLTTRYRRRSAAPRRRISEVRFDTHREILEPLIDWIGQQGRLPEPDEFAGAEPVIAEFGSLKRAFALIQRVTSCLTATPTACAPRTSDITNQKPPAPMGLGLNEWDQIRQRRTEDLLVSLALGKFRRRPPLSACPLDLQRDIRAFFGNYREACRQADELLFQAGQPEAIDAACQRSPIGKLLPNALYVHRSALEELEPLLRVYEGCARAYLGEIEEANLLKLHRFSGKLSYLMYPDFDTDPHPALFRCIKLSMRTLNVDCYDYANSANPPVLHRKETFLAPDHPFHAKFAKLTKQEEKQGLLDETATIGTRAGWQTRLTETGFRLSGHRLVREKH